MGERGHESVRAVVPEWERSMALDALNELVQVAAASMPAVARRAQLSESELHSLRHLMRDDIGPAELARMLGVTSAAATGIVDRLEARGHVERRPHPSDRRRTQIDLTDSGRAEVVQLLAPMFRGLAQADADLSEEERAVVTRFLHRATEAMRAVM
ncbi:MarR family transcriptional regulator [Luteococcus sp. H138]|uniref:MarR family winged helix-turn-helix transcriptional regulator n=1 Tax=unclassified Luteococcus TaxID=2639923 RepID=UPI00313ED2A8